MTIARQSPLGFYKGFGPVFIGIIPKMGIRFLSFESYKSMLGNTRLADPGNGALTDQGTFLGEKEETTLNFCPHLARMRLLSDQVLIKVPVTQLA